MTKTNSAQEMKAYQGIITKEEFIKELEWHYEQDNFRKGNYFKDGKGCAVGYQEFKDREVRGFEKITRDKNGTRGE